MAESESWNGRMWAQGIDARPLQVRRAVSRVFPLQFSFVGLTDLPVLGQLGRLLQ
jgi:hypothetical protein